MFEGMGCTEMCRPSMVDRNKFTSSMRLASVQHQLFRTDQGRVTWAELQPRIPEELPKL
jgi:hypothetical protein